MSPPLSATPGGVASAMRPVVGFAENSSQKRLKDPLVLPMRTVDQAVLGVTTDPAKGATTGDDDVVASDGEIVVVMGRTKNSGPARMVNARTFADNRRLARNSLTFVLMMCQQHG